MRLVKYPIFLVGWMAMSHMVLAKNIQVAIVGVMSGSMAQYGDMQFTGARQAIADINAQGGIDGEKLVAKEYDDNCDPKQAVAIANQVINDGIRYVIGHTCSFSTQPASDRYEEEGVVVITPAATNTELTTRGYKMILRTTGLDSEQGPAAAHYIVEAIKPKRIAIIHDQQQYGKGVALAVLDSLKQQGREVILFEGITAGERDFTTLVTRLKKEKIDFVYFGGYYREMGLILRQSRQIGLRARFMGPEGVGNVSLSNIAGDASEGMLVTLPVRYDLWPANLSIVNALKAKKRDPTGPFVWTTYAALQSLVTAIKRSGSREPADIIKDLKTNKPVNTVMGPLSWEENGDLTGFKFGIAKWHANGSSTMVK